MAYSFPPDVIVLDSEAVLYARFERGKNSPQVIQAKMYRLSPSTYHPGVVTPSINDEAALTDVVRRIKLDAGRLDLVSVLLPDSWFRINLIDVADLPSNKTEADEVVRWALKRSLPIRPEELRIAYQAIGRDAKGQKLLMVAALEKTLATIEAIFAATGTIVTLIEPIGLNIWNAVTVREPTTASDRLFFYFRNREFTAALFRGATPLFVRSKNLTGERTVDQEIRLSASYLRDNLPSSTLQNCYVAGDAVSESTLQTLKNEFETSVSRVNLKDFAEWPSTFDVSSMEAELTACTGVFTA